MIELRVGLRTTPPGPAFVVALGLAAATGTTTGGPARPGPGTTGPFPLTAAGCTIGGRARGRLLVPLEAGKDADEDEDEDEASTARAEVKAAAGPAL